VRWVVPFAPGGSTTLTARIFSEKLAQAWGHQFIIDNRGGAGGAIGADIVAKSAPDGYTLLFANPGPNVGTPLLSSTAPYKPEDFASVILFGTAPLILIAHPAFPPKSPKELVEHLKAKPGKVNWGSSGTGGITHIGLLLFQNATRTDYTHVPYKGNGPAFTDLVGGHIDLLYATTVSADALIKAKRVKVIGVAASKRLQSLPEVPTLAENGVKDAEVAGWFGMSAPAKTPRAIIAKLNREANRIMQTPDAKRRLDELGMEIDGGSPADFDRFLQREIAQLKTLIKQGALKPE
jgi:tripartite-type tricarboxylate transporter receptor subunit TctC